MCDRCLQYSEDCSCCHACGGIEGHERFCDEVTTQRSSVAVLRKQTLRGLGRVARLVVCVDDDAYGAESTRQFVAVR